MKAIILMLVVTMMVGCRPKAPKVRVDPNVTAAIAEARASLTNFITVLQSPSSNQTFFQVLASFSTASPHHGEALWVNVWKYEDGLFTGAVSSGNPDIDSTGLTNWHPVFIAVSNVWDWSYVDRRKGKVGNFIMRTQQ
jgi:uncharacterized protein YegJ (DUF2314 family)